MWQPFDYQLENVFGFFFLSTMELHFQTAAHRPEGGTRQDLVLSSGFVYSGQPGKWKKRPYLYPLLVFILLRCCFCTLITCSLSFHPHILFSASSHCSLSEKKVLHWYSLPHLNTLHPLSLSLPPLSQVCCISSTSSCGGPDPASSTPHHLTSLGRPTTAARPLTPSRSA